MRSAAAGRGEENLPVTAAGAAQGRAPGPASDGASVPREQESEEEIARKGASSSSDGPGFDAPGEEQGKGDDVFFFYPFPSPFQSEPADLMTPAFAGRRRRLLEGVYAGVERGEAGTLIRRAWSRHHGEACTGEKRASGVDELRGGWFAPTDSQ